jgi:monofunctional biosynthetic peptidoglycan transglycosylase
MPTVRTALFELIQKTCSRLPQGVKFGGTNKSRTETDTTCPEENVPAAAESEPVFELIFKTQFLTNGLALRVAVGFPLQMSPTIYQPERRPERGRIRKGRLFLIALGLLAVYIGWEALTWPDVTLLQKGHPKSTAFIDAYRHGGLFGRMRGVERPVQQRWVPYRRISSNLKRAVIVSEDIRFYKHAGFDDQEIKAALADAWEEKEIPRGASTITQQLARNLYLSPSRNPLRKVKEAILTHQLENALTKRRILELYLNVVELGEGIYGAEAASRRYYGRSAAGLSERQGAELAASLPAPKVWHPGSKSRTYQRKIRTILRRMNRARWLWGEI